jgi:hypothetical protein
MALVEFRMSDTTTKQIAKRRFPNRQKPERRGSGVLLDTGELAVALGETDRTIRTWRQAKKIPAITLGFRTHRYRLQDVIDALSRFQVKAVRKTKPAT